LRGNEILVIHRAGTTFSSYVIRTCSQVLIKRFLVQEEILVEEKVQEKKGGTSWHVLTLLLLLLLYSRYRS